MMATVKLSSLTASDDHKMQKLLVLFHSFIKTEVLQSTADLICKADIFIYGCLQWFLPVRITEFSSVFFFFCLVFSSFFL